MRIAYDARCIRAQMTGVGYYASFLAGALPDARPDDHFTFLGLRSENPALYPEGAVHRPNVEWLEIDSDYEAHPRGDWWEHVRLPLLLDGLGVDVLHGPAFLVPFGFRRPRAARVATVHDLSVFTEPQAYPARFRHYLRFVIRRVVRGADRIVCHSEFVRSDILARIGGARAERIAVAPLAPAAAFVEEGEESGAATRERLRLPERFLLMVGTFEERKNPAFLAPLYEALGSRLDGAPPAFVWVGKRGHDAERLLEKLAPLSERGLFHLRDDLAFADLPAVCRAAVVMVYPSRNEGFGLPAREAMACGLPVVASDATSLPETVGEGGLCLPLDAPRRWADALVALLENPALHQDAAARARDYARRFTWEEVARQTARVYEDAVRDAHSSPPSSSRR